MGGRSGQTINRGQAQSKLQSILSDVESRIAGQQFESSAVFDENGNQLLFKDGKKHSVTFTPAELELMGGSILTHNHPLDVSFSRADIIFLTGNRLKEIRAVTKTRVFSLRLKDENIRPDWRRMKNEYNKSLRRVNKQIDNEVRAGKITVAEVNKGDYYNERIIKDFFKNNDYYEYTIKYR